MDHDGNRKVIAGTLDKLISHLADGKFAGK